MTNSRDIDIYTSTMTLSDSSKQLKLAKDVELEPEAVCCDLIKIQIEKKNIRI